MGQTGWEVGVLWGRQGGRWGWCGVDRVGGGGGVG